MSKKSKNSAQKSNKAKGSNEEATWKKADKGVGWDASAKQGHATGLFDEKGLTRKVKGGSNDDREAISRWKNGNGNGTSSF
jgi:hypothetical protein